MPPAGSRKKTNGRSHGIPAPVRAGISAVAALAPGLAARGIAELCMRPPRHPAPERERDAADGAEPVAVAHPGGEVRGWRRGRGPAVLLLHGWGGRAGQLAPVGEALVAAGCEVVALDAPAHGRSSGRTVSVPLYAGAIAAAAREVGARAAVGHSFGGAALAFAIARGLELDAAVLIGTPARPVRFVDQVCEMFRLSPRARRALQARLEARVGHRFEELDLTRAMAAVRTPALVIHDRGDREVAFASAEALARAWPGARLHPTEGLGHQRILRDGAVAAEVAAFVAGELGRGPGGVAPSEEGSAAPVPPRVA